MILLFDNGIFLALILIQIFKELVKELFLVDLVVRRQKY